MAEGDWWDDLVISFIDITVTAAVTAGINSLTRGEANKAAGSQFALKEGRPPAFIFTGDPSRGAGATNFFEVDRSVFMTCQAVYDGRFEFTGHFLNDDKVGLGGSGQINAIIDGTDDGRYVDDRMIVLTRSGLPTETAYDDLITYFPDLWSEDHRGDGVASAMMLCRAPDSKFFGQAFPNGKPSYSAIGRATDYYDWRDPSQSRSDPSTWGPTGNPLVQWVHHEWFRWGMNWDRHIAPVLEDLTAQANICDEPVPLKAGGTQPRYRCGGNYPADLKKDAVRKYFRDSMDGFDTRDGRGCLVIKAGKYEEPDITVDIDPALGDTYEWVKGVESETAIGTLLISYTSPEHKFNQVECEPWEIDPDNGDNDNLELLWVQNTPQARRLGKRAAYKRMPRRRGMFTKGPEGFKLLGKRTLRLTNRLEPTMNNVTVEVISSTADVANGRYQFNVRTIGPEIDAWNPDAEEGNPVTLAERPVSQPLMAPTITAASAFFGSLGGAEGVRVGIWATGPVRSDISWFSRHRIAGSATWVTTEHPDVTGSSVTIETGFVSAVAALEVQVTYQIGSGQLAPWSATTTVNTTVTEAAPSAPTALSLTTPNSGAINVAVTQSSSVNAAYLKIYRGSTNVLADAVQVNSLLASPGQAIAYPMSGMAAGTYYVWSRATTVNGTSSTPAGPQSITIT